jgi:hypothetical protein
MSKAGCEDRIEQCHSSVPLNNHTILVQVYKFGTYMYWYTDINLGHLNLNFDVFGLFLLLFEGEKQLQIKQYINKLNMFGPEFENQTCAQ